MNGIHIMMLHLVNISSLLLHFIAGKCKINNITGNFSKQSKNKITFTFSADHDDAVFHCKVNQKFKNCKYLIVHNQDTYVHMYIALICDWISKSVQFIHNK